MVDCLAAWGLFALALAVLGYLDERKRNRRYREYEKWMR